LQDLKQQFEPIEFFKEKSIHDFLEIDTLVNKPKNNNGNITEKQVMEKTMQTLSRWFNYAIAATQESRS